MKGISLDHIKQALAAPPTNKHKHEFQEVCEELERVYGKAAWLLPSLKDVTPHKIKEAAAIARKRGNLTFSYLRGIIKRLP